MKQFLLCFISLATITYCSTDNDMQITTDTEWSEEKIVEEIADNTGIVRITIMIYKDQYQHDKEQWNTIIKKTAQTCNRFRDYNDQPSNVNVPKELESIIKDLVVNDENSGIITECTIETSDGRALPGCCGSNCQCLMLYRGNCPCSLDNQLQRCLFPQEQLPFDDQYESDDNAVDESESDEDLDSETSSSSPMYDNDIFEEIDLTSKNRACCC